MLSLVKDLIKFINFIFSKLIKLLDKGKLMLNVKYELVSKNHDQINFNNSIIYNIIAGTSYSFISIPKYDQ